MSINDEIDGGGQEVYPIFPPQPKPPLAKRIRDFFETLFPNKLVLELRAELNEIRHERDYFKGRAERLELLLTQPRVANREITGSSAPDPRTHTSGTVGGRKTWQQVISDRRKELAQLALDKQKKPETSAPAKPAQN